MVFAVFEYFSERSRPRSVAKSAGLSTPFKILTALFALGASAFFVVLGLQRLEFLRLLEALESAPGYAVDRLGRNGSNFELRGRRDPLAAPLADVANSVEIDIGRIDALLEPFESLDPEIVRQRAASMLEIPVGVELGVTQNVLRVYGPAPIEWQHEIGSKLGAVAGVDVFTVSMNDADHAAVVREYIGAPETVIVEHAEGVTKVSGAAPRGWIDQARVRLSEVPWSTNIDELESINSQLLRSLESEVAELDGRTFYFSNGVNLRTDSRAALTVFAKRLAGIASRAESAASTLSIRITGHTDGIGGVEINTALAARRAVAIKAQLVLAGVPQATIDTAGEAANNGVLDLDARRAVVRLQRAAKHL